MHAALLLAVCAAAARGALVYHSVVCKETMKAGGVAAANSVSGYHTDPECVVSPGVVAGASAWAGFSNDVNTTGWADLRVHTPVGAGGRCPVVAAWHCLCPDFDAFVMPARGPHCPCS